MPAPGAVNVLVPVASEDGFASVPSEEPGAPPLAAWMRTSYVGVPVAVAETVSQDLDLPVEALDLSERPRNCLRRAQINTVGELTKQTREDLLDMTNFGQKSLEEVIAKLDELGLGIAPSRDRNS